MKKNMGSTDRVIRVLLAVLFFYLGFSGTVTGVAGVIVMVLGAVFILTASVSFCPLYLPFGISTCKSEKQENN